MTDVPPKRVRNAIVQTASPEEWVKLVESRDWVETYEDAKSLIAQRWPMGSFRVGMESYNPLATPRGGDAVVVLGPQPSKEQPVATLLAAGHPEMVKYLEVKGVSYAAVSTGTYKKQADGEGDCARYVLLTKAEEKGETLETWYFALEELKEAVQDLKRTRLEVMLPTKAEPMCFRKLLDIVFGRTQVTVTLCLPPAPKPASQVATTRTAVKRSATRPIALPGKGKVRKADATSTILVSNKDQEFPELLKTVKEALKNQDVGVELKAATATKKGDVLLSVKGGKDLSKIQKVLTSKTGATVTTRLAGERLVLVKDIDASTCDKEVIAAIRSAFPDKNTESVKVESLRSSYKDGPQTARVRAEKGLVDAMLERGKIRVGIFTCRVRPVVEVDRCARCGAITHRASQCTKGKRSCFKCGGEGHEARSCKETKVFCTSCNKEGHNAGSIRCPLYSRVVSMETQRVQTRKPTPPTKSRQDPSGNQAESERSQKGSSPSYSWQERALPWDGPHLIARTRGIHMKKVNLKQEKEAGKLAGEGTLRKDLSKTDALKVAAGKQTAKLDEAENPKTPGEDSSLGNINPFGRSSMTPRSPQRKVQTSLIVGQTPKLDETIEVYKETPTGAIPRRKRVSTPEEAHKVKKLVETRIKKQKSLFSDQAGCGCWMQQPWLGGAQSNQERALPWDGPHLIARTRGIHMKKVNLKQEKEAGKLAGEGTLRKDLSKTDALKVAAGKQTAKLDEAENPKTPGEDSSLGNINPFGRSSMTPRSPQRKVQTSLIVGQTPKLDETIEVYKETPTGAIPKRKRVSTPEEAHKVKKLVETRIKKQKSLVLGNITCTDILQAFTQVTSRLAKKVKVLQDRIDDTPNTRREIKNDAKAVCYAMADMQAMQDDVFEEIFKWQRHIQMEDSDDDVVLVESPENKGVGIQVATQTKEVVTKNAETQTPLEMWGKSTQVTEMSQPGQLREPLYIGDKRSFVDFKDLSKRDWKESYFEKVKIKAVNPLAMMPEAAPTIIRSRDKKEEGALLKMLHQRCPEYRESVLEGENPIESKVTPIVRSVVVGHVAGPKETLKNYMFVVAGDEKNKASGYLKETYEALEELKEVLKELQIEKVAIGSDLTGREEHLRKMLEYIFRGENVEVTLCVPIAKKMIWRDQGKAQSAISVSPKGMRKTDAVIVQGSKTETYEAVLKEVRESLAETDCEIRTVRKTREGKLLLLVGKEGDQAKKVKEALSSKMANRKIVLRDDSTKEDKVLHVKGLDALAVETEIVSSVVAAMDGTITNTDLEVTSLRKAYGGSKVATIKVSAKSADAILSKGKIKIGLVTCKITERVNSVFCYRCWEPGHMAARCQGVDRSKLCHRCGEEGHSVKTCEKEMFCPVCGVRGHRAKTLVCESLRKKAARAENEKPPRTGRDVILMSEPNEGRVRSNGWWTDDANDVAIAVMNKKIKVYARGKGLGFVWIDTGECIIYSCYISPNVETVIAERALRNLVGSIGSHGGKPCVVTGDFNAKSPEWGGETQDERGRLLSEWLATLNCVVYNDGIKPTFLKGRYQSWIDVTFSTENAARWVRNWTVEEEETLSDHQFITFQLKLNGERTGNGQSSGRCCGWNTKGFSPSVIRHSFVERMNAKQNKNCVSMVEAIKEACDMHLPKKGRTRNTGKQRVYWWNDDIARARNECISVKRRQMRLRARNRLEEVIEVTELYKQKRKIYRVLIRKAKEAKWEELINEIERDQWGLGYQIATRKLRLGSEQITLSPQFRQRIADVLFPKHQIKRWNLTETCEVEGITSNEMQQAVRKLKMGKVPGLDNIPVEIVKAIAHEQGEVLMLEAYNGLLREGKFPKEWKRAKLVLLKKPGKEGGSPSDFRPICLLNVVAKLYEQLILIKLKKELEEKGGLSEEQFGFQEGKSTLDAVDRVMALARWANSGDTRRKRWCVLLTFDVKNAFNSANWQNIMEALRKKGISMYLRKVIGSYLSERSLDLGEGQVMEVTSGVPQGSVLGPTLWNILYDGVLRLEIPKEATLVAYADDLALVVIEKDIENLMCTVEMKSKIIGRWMKENGLQVAPEKTEAVLLAGGRRPDKNIVFKVENVELRPKQNVRYLGVDINQRMTFTSHVMRVAAKAEKMGAMLGRLMPNVKGPSPSKRKVMAEVVNSIVMYAAPIWGPTALDMLKYQERLVQVQRKTALRVCSAYRTVSADAVQVIAGMIPIDLRIHETVKVRNRTHTKREAREWSIKEWQNRWNASSKGRWTHRLIPDIRQWIERKKNAGQVNFYLTQFLSGHGDFRCYLRKMHRAENDRCVYCGEMDTAEHVLFQCGKWAGIRHRLEQLVNEKINPDNLVEIMLRSNNNWRKVQRCTEDILKFKMEDEKTGQINSPRDPSEVLTRAEASGGVETDKPGPLKTCLTAIPGLRVGEERGNQFYLKVGFHVQERGGAPGQSPCEVGCLPSGASPGWRIGESLPDMGGTGEIKYPGRTKTSQDHTVTPDVVWKRGPRGFGAARKKLTVQGRDTLVPVGEGVVGQALPDGQPTTVQTPSVRSQAEASPKATDFKRGSRQTLYEKISRSHSLGSADKKRKYTDMSPGYERSIEPYKKVESPEAFVLTEALDMVIKLGLDLERRIENNTKREIKDLSARLKRQVEILSRTSVRAWVESHRYIEPEKIQIDVDIQTEALGEGHADELARKEETHNEEILSLRSEVERLRQENEELRRMNRQPQEKTPHDQTTPQVYEGLKENVTAENFEKLIDLKWTNQAYAKTTFVRNDAVKCEDQVVVVEAASGEDVAERLTTRFPEIAPATATSVPTPGTALCVTKSRTIELENGERVEDIIGRSILLNIGKDHQNRRKNLMNGMRKVATLASNKGIKKFRLYSLIDEPNSQKFETRKITEWALYDTEMMAEVYVPRARNRKSTAGASEPEPESEEWEEQKTKRRRTTKTITVSKAETDEQTYASMLKRLKGEINVEEIGVTVKGVYETSDGRIKINLTEKGKGNCEKFRTAIEEKLGNKAEAKITMARKELIITGIDKETTEEEVRLAIQQHYTEKTACPEDTQVRSFHSNERTNKQTATVLVPETEALHLLQKRKVIIGWTMCRIVEKLRPERCHRCLKYGHRAKECKEKAGENNTEKGGRCLKCGRWGHHAKACQNEPHCYECEQQGHRADSMACPKMAHAMLAKLTHELEASVVTVSEPNLTLAEKEAWLVDDTGSAAIKITDRSLNITDSGNGSSFAWARTGDMTYISCYISPNISAAAFETRLQELEAFLRTHHGNKLLIGDFNAANRAWGSSTNDRRGQLVIEMTEALGMTLLNTGHSPTFLGSGGTSIVDLAFIDDSAAGRVRNWTVLEAETMSDHRAIAIDIEDHRARPATGDHRYGGKAHALRWTKDRDKQLREQLAEILPRINTVDPISVSRAIGEAAQRSLKKIANNRKPIFWWTDEVGNARQRCNAARRRAGRARDDRKTELWRIYKDERKALKKEIKKAKAEAWQRLIEDIEHDPWGKGYRIAIGRAAPRQQVSERERWRAARELFPQCAIPMYDMQEACEPTMFSYEEIQAAAARMRMGKAAGPDGLGPEIVQAAVAASPETISGLVNDLLKSQKFPEQWKRARLALIPKAKKSPDKLPKYRPICVLDSLGKFYEQLILARLLGELEAKGGLSDSQYGFVRGRSTIDAMQDVLRVVEWCSTGSYGRRELCALILLDVANAFNSVRWPDIIQALIDKGISAYLVNLVRSYLTDRFIIVQHGDGFNATCGVPQGSVLGPLLWNFVYDEVLHLDVPVGVRLFAFADDLAMVAMGMPADELQNNANLAFDTVNRWMCSKHLTLVAEKTEAVIMTGRRDHADTRFIVGDSVVKPSESARYLGVYMDRKGTFAQHIAEAAAGTTKLTGKLSRILPNLRGASEGRRRTIAAAVTCKMMYGSEIWSKGLDKLSNAEKVNRAQRPIMLRVACAYRTVATTSLQVLCSMVPWDMLALERRATFKRAENRKAEREKTIRQWKDRWDKESRHSWTKRLIPEIEPWQTRRHGLLDFYITQMMTGHGCFSSYLSRIEREATEDCWYCDCTRDDAEHTFFDCPRWTEERSEAEHILGAFPEPETLVGEMLKDERTWKATLRPPPADGIDNSEQPTRSNVLKDSPGSVGCHIADEEKGFSGQVRSGQVRSGQVRSGGRGRPTGRPDKIKVLQCNLNRSREAFQLLHGTVHDRQIDIAVVAEPNKKLSEMGPWTLDRRKDVAIRQFNKAEALRKHIGNGFVGVEYRGYALYGCYISPNSTLDEFKQLLRELEGHLNSSGEECIIVGDFNAKSPAWGSKKEDERGRILMDWIAQRDYTIQNTGDEPTFVRGESVSNIDLTITSNGLADKIKNWKVLPEENLSDHRDIYFEICKTKEENEARTKRVRKSWKIDGERLNIYRELVRKEISGRGRHWSTGTLMQKIEEMCNSSFATCRGGHPAHKRPVYWWNRDIAEQRAKCLKARRTLGRGRKCRKTTSEQIQQLEDRYRMTKKELRGHIKKAKQTAWKELIEMIEEDPWGKGYKVAMGKFRKETPPSKEETKEAVKKLFPRRERTVWQKEPCQEKIEFSEQELRDAASRLRVKSNWRTLDAESLSDHKYIAFTWDDNAGTTCQTSGYTGWNLKRLDKDKLLSKLREATCESTPASLNKILQRACNAAMPKKRCFRNRRPVYWWNEKIANLRKNALKFRRTITRLRSKRQVSVMLIDGTTSKLKQAQKMLRDEIQKAKSEKWKELCLSLEDDLWGNGYQTVMKRTGQACPFKLPREQLNNMVAILFPLHADVDWIKENCKPIPDFTHDELRDAARRLKSGKAPGPDGVPGEIIKIMVEERPDTLLEIFNRCAKDSTFPDCWKIARLILLPKPGKLNRTANAFRPICILDASGKLYEYLLYKRLEDEIEQRGGLSPFQFGFRKGVSTVHAIDEVIRTAEQEKLPSYRHRKTCLMITFDVQNAFNSASWQIILEELKQKGISPSLINTIRDYLNNRKIITDYGDTVKVNSGVPQGSVLAALLWNVMYDSVLRIATSENVKLIGYADDLAVIITCKQIDDLEETANHVVAQIADWMETKRLKLAPEKTECILLRCKRKPPAVKINVLGTEISPKSSIKYLGVWIDQNCGFKQHIQQTAIKVEKTITALSSVMPNIGGPSSSKRRMLSSVAHSAMLYGAPIWHNAMTIESYKKKLFSLQRRLAIRIASAYRTAPTDAIMVISRSGQVRSGQVRSGQVRSGQVRSGQVRSPCEVWLVFHRAPPQVADRGKPPRYGWYRGNQIPGADQNQSRSHRKSRRGLETGAARFRGCETIMSDESRKKLTVQGRDTLVPVGEGVVGQALPDGQPTTVQTPSVRSQAEASPKATDFKRGSRQTLYEKISRSHSLGSADKKRKYTDMSPGYERSIEPYKKVESPEAFVLTEALDMVIKLGLDLERRIENNTKREIKDLSARLKRQVEILSRTSVRAWVESHRYIEPEKIQIDVDIQTEALGEGHADELARKEETHNEEILSLRSEVERLRQENEELRRMNRQPQEKTPHDQTTPQVYEGLKENVTAENFEKLIDLKWTNQAYAKTTFVRNDAVKCEDQVVVVEAASGEDVAERLTTRFPEIAPATATSVPTPGTALCVTKSRTIELENGERVEDIIGRSILLNIAGSSESKRT
ncbi:hypothetical protein TcasGA2_TC032967 [Tribolium castaneum]|uniref:Reverse transcriptase n=1 Tax=Tribolium castaneum TaxID=7070 RepID=A0A139WN93_TRICA|nr:hypothetical protein TcasGA2_TC032967 [Tribolium castaneum]